MEKDKVYPWVIRLPILYGDDKSLHRLCCSTPSPPCSLWLRVYTRPLRGLDAFHKGILVTLDLLTWNGPNGPTAGSGRARSAAAGTFVDPPLSALKTSLLVLDIEATLDVALYYPPGPSQKKSSISPHVSATSHPILTIAWTILFFAECTLDSFLFWLINLID